MKVVTWRSQTGTCPEEKDAYCIEAWIYALTKSDIIAELEIHGVRI